mgnify:CR=1 FL=1
MNSDTHSNRIYFPSHSSTIGYHGKCMVELRDTPTDTKAKNRSLNVATALEMYMMIDINSFNSNEELKLQITPVCPLCKQKLCEIPK